MGTLVLWVEDEPETVYYERRFAEAQNWQITFASNAEVAQRQISEQRFDLVVLDLIIACDEYNHMRRKVEPTAGVDLVYWIRDDNAARQTPRDVPILVVTAVVSADTKKRVIAKLASPEYYLQKPVITAVYEKTVVALAKQIASSPRDPTNGHHAAA